MTDGMQVVVVVTGAFGVLGAAVARAFARNGARVALVDVAPQPSLELQSEFGAAHMLLGGADLSNVDSTRKTMAAIAMRFGGIDVLVNVAGGFRWEKLEDGSVDTWDQLYSMNLRTAVVSASVRCRRCSSAARDASSTSAQARRRKRAQAWARMRPRKRACKNSPKRCPKK